MKKEAQQIVKMDLVKIFLTPPNTKKEKIVLILLMLITFMIFFGPICFTEISPIRAILIASMPTLSISWGLIALLRAKYRIKDFCK
ncbi:MAG: hypothetical protein E7L17_12530 [Clostridium sp.]|uniref:hypothetical protein n=1 Tax=Clostridium sp. TaxID=1506 RepID=UPI002913974C|nr:hypothetical protein [Clostridium sp.]MDU7338929.1 hypothetical protein [Clostridium sp.]